MKKNVRHLVSTLILSGFVIIGFGSGDEKVSEVESTTEMETVKDKEWAEVYTFKGNGMKKSPVFTLNGNDARVKYKYRATDGVGIGMFAIYVVDEGVDIMKEGGIPEIMTQSENEESETSIQKAAGNYYLNINASGNWTVIVEELK